MQMLPENGNGWFPQLRADGTIVCGSLEVFVGRPNDWRSLGAGGRPIWLDDDRVLFGTQAGATILADLVTGQRDVLPGYNWRIAGNGSWYGNRTGYGIDEYRDTTKLNPSPITGRFYHSLSPDGLRVAYVDNPQQEIKTLFLNNTAIETADIHEASVTNQSLCWLVATSVYGRAVHGWRGGVVEDWSLFDSEGGPQVFDMPDGPWVASGLGGGPNPQPVSLILRPAGAKVGYRLLGDHYNPHVRWIASLGKICVVSSTDAGVLQVEWVDPASARVDLRATVVTPPTPVPTAIAPPVNTKALVGAWRADATTPGNLSMGAHPSKVVICNLEELPLVDPTRLVGLFVDHYRSAGQPDIPLDARIAQCRPVADRLQILLFVFIDDRVYDEAQVARWCGTTPWVRMPQFYIDCRGKEGESVDAFAAEIAAEARRFTGPWLPAIRITTGISTIAASKVVAALNRIVPLMGDSKCLGWALFAWNRADGPTSVPALMPAATAWLTGTPTLQPSGARAWAAQFFAAPLAVTVTEYTREGVAPLRVMADYAIAGGRAIDRVELRLNGVTVATGAERVGRLEALVAAPADYVLTVTAFADGQSASTGAIRTVRVLRPPAPPTPEIPGITYPTEPGSGTAEAARTPSQAAADRAQRENEGDK